MRLPGYRASGFTLTEMSVSMVVGSIVGAFVMTYMHVTSILIAKNLSTNYSHNSLHKSLDWAADRIQQAEYVPVLLTTGTTVSLTGTSGNPAFSTSGSAAISQQSTEVVGIYYDRLVGYPYILPSTSGSGSVSAGATTLTLQYSNNVYSNPPAPQTNDVILVSGSATVTSGSGSAAVTSTVRPLVSSVTLSTSGSYQSAGITLSGSFGVTYAWSWGSGEYQAASLVHREAFIVMSNTSTGNFELRYYPNFEGLTALASPTFASGSTTVSYVALTTANITALNNTTNYQVITDQFAQVPPTVAPCGPFSEITTTAGATLVGLDFRIRGTQYDNVLDTAETSASAGSTKEANEFSQFARVITVAPLREHPVGVFQ